MNDLTRFLAYVGSSSLSLVCLYSIINAFYFFKSKKASTRKIGRVYATDAVMKAFHLHSDFFYELAFDFNLGETKFGVADESADGTGCFLLLSKEDAAKFTWHDFHRLNTHVLVFVREGETLEAKDENGLVVWRFNRSFTIPVKGDKEFIKI